MSDLNAAPIEFAVAVIAHYTSERATTGAYERTKTKRSENYFQTRHKTGILIESQVLGELMPNSTIAARTQTGSKKLNAREKKNLGITGGKYATFTYTYGSITVEITSSYTKASNSKDLFIGGDVKQIVIK